MRKQIIVHSRQAAAGIAVLAPTYNINEQKRSNKYF